MSTTVCLARSRPVV